MPLLPPSPTGRQPRLFALSVENRAIRHMRYCPHEDLEMRARTLLTNLERELRTAGAEVTIHALWVELADRAGKRVGPDVGAAAALAGMAMG